jgi:CspA family cold shock protein
MPTKKKTETAIKEHSSSVPVLGNLSATTISISITTETPELIALFKRIPNGSLQFETKISESEMNDSKSKAKITVKLRPSVLGLHDATTLVVETKSLDAKLTKLLRLAYTVASELDESDWVTLAEYGNSIKKLDVTFEPKAFGVSSLLTFVTSHPEIFQIRYDSAHTPPVPYIRLKDTDVKVSESKPATSGARSIGKIHNLKESLGYGFIAPEQGENLYFHSSDVIGSPFASLRTGDKVEYVASLNERGPCAKEVRKVG